MPQNTATVTSKGQITLPVDLRRKWALAAGDSVEFFSDPLGNWYVRPLNRAPTAFFENLKSRLRLPGVTTDEDAIATAVIKRNRPRARQAAE